jgi:hypothetical protein
LESALQAGTSWTVARTDMFIATIAQRFVAGTLWSRLEHPCTLDAHTHAEFAELFAGFKSGGINQFTNPATANASQVSW